MKQAYIFDAVRTPRGRGKADGSLHSSRPITLAAECLKAIRDRNNLNTQLVDDVILGCVTPIGEQGGDVAKAAALHADYHQSVAGVTLNRFCGSGLEAINQAATNIMSGQFDLQVAGGVECMSRIAMGSDGGALMIDPELSFKVGFVPQGIGADLIATLRGYTREDVDRFAIESQKKAAIAWEEKRFQKSIIPIKDSLGRILLDRDEHMRPDTTFEKISQLKPAFLELGEKWGLDSVAYKKYPRVESIQHVHHAGNSSGIVDGAAAVLIGSEEMGIELKLKPRARIISMAAVGSEPTIMLTGPAPATLKALARANMKASDIDLYEVNEAFAAVVMNFRDELEIPDSKINVNGGAIALGHPLGATGAMLMSTLIDELERTKKRFGCITLCIGGGMGIATIIERI
ncbi:MAG: acetyl-CoA acetyltransferase [Bdellovibrio sp. CG12_big_fil_rev_8_21_14_0_65_39_13]|nr:MAG: acetyl-CoA acetyltransferase [Bdellovibrio sp. CG22_combo_CG10-13_8_21_14_all_39_27]PIQ60008.1 MAG: acetyl-CoA acetyltransferase [Bdellovibrio sp. CG12_big_fil_rev_8_21_14_0_65_39_13]PIR35267.1 MAG: acetyl-CoA acetyltransferase [Bdellovibrio sp. CG11_big_fil_rev_8_21_14_0_20_39_38]